MIRFLQIHLEVVLSLPVIALIASALSFVGMVIMVIKFNRGPKEDPRLSQALQLLQSKIAILEDLSDRTDTQVTQLTNFLEHKSKQLQAKVQEAQEHLRLIDQATNKSLEVASIFQDKIPHEEIIERKNTLKYVQAARLSHQGKSIDDIAKEVDLPRGEIEMIAKVNREELVFSDQKLPEWAKKMAMDTPKSSSGPLIEMNDGGRSKMLVKKTFEVDYSKAFEVAKPDLTQVKQMNKDLKRASTTAPEKSFLDSTLPSEGITKVASQIVGAAKTIGDKIVSATGQMLAEQPRATTTVVPNSYVKENLNVNKNETKEVDSSEIKKVLFPKIDLNDNLG